MASSKSLQQAIANIKIWHKGEQRAPHKPLLLRLWIGNLRTSAQFTGTFWATAFTLPT